MGEKEASVEGELFTVLEGNARASIGYLRVLDCRDKSLASICDKTA
jgi:hypothetical protein